MPSKLYVGNLAYSVSNSDLEHLFSEAGQVQSATVIMDQFRQKKGFGFVEIASTNDTSKAIAQFNGSDLKDRNIKVDEPNLANRRAIAALPTPIAAITAGLWRAVAG